jgi:hypothetical protein
MAPSGKSVCADEESGYVAQWRWENAQEELRRLRQKLCYKEEEVNRLRQTVVGLEKTVRDLRKMLKFCHLIGVERCDIQKDSETIRNRVAAFKSWTAGHSLIETNLVSQEPCAPFAEQTLPHLFFSRRSVHELAA